MTLSMGKVRELTNGELINRANSVGAEKPYHKVSNKYSFVPTIKAVDCLRDAGWTPVEASQAKVREEDRNGLQKHMVRFSRNDLMVGDKRMDLLLYNSHDRGCAFKLIGGVFRLVCSNGMVIGNKLAEFSHRHVGFNVDNFIESATNINSFLEVANTSIKNWGEIELTERDKGLFADAANELCFGENSNVESSQLLIPRRSQDNSDDLWTVYNRAQENIIKGGLSGTSANGRRTVTRGITSIERDRKLNQNLWVLSENMYDMKIAA